MPGNKKMGGGVGEREREKVKSLRPLHARNGSLIEPLPLFAERQLHCAPSLGRSTYIVARADYTKRPSNRVRRLLLCELEGGR